MNLGRFLHDTFSYFVLIIELLHTRKSAQIILANVVRQTISLDIVPFILRNILQFKFKCMRFA